LLQFQIHQQLLADCHYLGKLSLCHVLLNKNSTVPWFILVPETDATDFLDLPDSQRAQIMDECVQISRWIKQHYSISRINFGAIGNIVPQLHLHVIGRSINDACWPKPVWGNLDVHKDYSTDDIKLIRQQLVTDHELVIGDDPGC
jgi:diadenosine tetraphosphate (Ap4A) HIT family hydrolase